MRSAPVSLLERLRRPEHQASWERFVGLFTPFRYRCARRLGLRSGDAVGLMRGAFAALVRKPPEFRYDPGRGFRARPRTVALTKLRENDRRSTPPARLFGWCLHLAVQTVVCRRA